MASFDIVSELDQHEVQNAVDQANREVDTRYDFKDADASFTLDKETIKLCSETEYQVQQMIEILKTKLAKRQVDLRHMDIGEPNVQHKKTELTVSLKQGIATDTAKKIIKLIKGEKFKVQATIQGEQVRVSGKKLDELQSVIGWLKEQELDLPLQFTNYRD